MPSHTQRYEDGFAERLAVKTTRAALNLATSLGEAAPRDALSWGDVLSFLATKTRRVAFLEKILRARLVTAIIHWVLFGSSCLGGE